MFVSPDRDVDPVGNPAIRVARSRKVQKGEDKAFEMPDARWVATRVEGSGKTINNDNASNTVHFSAFGLFDGHGGKACAEHCSATMLDCVLAALDSHGPIQGDADAHDVFEERLPAALKRGFDTCDTEFLKRDIHSGATATVVVVHGRSITTASVGDSLAIVDLGVSCGFAGPAQRLSPEHRLDTSGSERDRILAAGGEVRATAFEDGKPVGPLRVWPGGLAVSRTIGDRDGKKGGVISEPEISRVVVPDEQPGFRITLASDGLWDAATVKQAAQCSGKLATTAAAAALCKLAQKQKDNRDDITVLVIDCLADPTHKDPFILKPPWKIEMPVKWLLREPSKKKKKESELSKEKDTHSDKTHSERVAFRLEASARGEAAVVAAKADTLEAAAAVEAVRKQEAQLMSIEGDDLNDSGGWEEMPSSHGYASPEKVLPSPAKKNSKDKGKKEKGQAVDKQSANAMTAVVDMGNLSVSGGGQKPAPRPVPVPLVPVAPVPVSLIEASQAAPTTPAKKEKRKGKRERAAERAAAEAAGGGGVSTITAPPPPVAAQVSGEAAALVAQQMAQLAELQCRQMELQHSISSAQRDAPPTFQGQHMAPQGQQSLNPTQQFHPQFQGQAQFNQCQHPNAPPLPPHRFAPLQHFLPPHLANPAVAHLHSVGSTGTISPASSSVSLEGAGTGSDGGDGKTKQKRKGKRERAQERARREAEAAAEGGT